jgi:hypothetical protein
MPKAASITYNGTAASTAGGETLAITGTGFSVGVTIYINDTPVGVVSRVNYTRLTFVTPARSAGIYKLIIVNPDGGWSQILPGIVYA